jgi:hypothetical protein
MEALDIEWSLLVVYAIFGVAVASIGLGLWAIFRK